MQCACRLVNVGGTQPIGMYRQKLKKGERFENFSAGGSGWGDPRKRAPEAIAYDLRNGYISSAPNTPTTDDSK